MAAVVTATKHTYVVRGGDAHVVAMFWGADAPAEARYWTDRGYRVESVDSSLIV